MKSKIELLRELIGKDVVFDWVEGGSHAFSIFDYSKYFGTDFKKEFGHHIIVEVGIDMIKTKWLGQKGLPKYPDLSGYFSIDYISSIRFDI